MVYAKYNVHFLFGYRHLQKILVFFKHNVYNTTSNTYFSISVFFNVVHFQQTLMYCNKMSAGYEGHQDVLVTSSEGIRKGIHSYSTGCKIIAAFSLWSI